MLGYTVTTTPVYQNQTPKQWQNNEQLLILQIWAREPKRNPFIRESFTSYPYIYPYTPTFHKNTNFILIYFKLIYYFIFIFIF